MKKVFEFKCQDCGEIHEAYIEFERIGNVEQNSKCQICGGKLKRVFTFGMGKLNGTGFTRRIV